MKAANKRLLARVAALEAALSPPAATVYMLAIGGTLSAEDEARRREAAAVGRRVIVYSLGTQQPGTVEPDAIAIAPERAQARPEGMPAPTAPPEAPAAPIARARAGAGWSSSCERVALHERRPIQVVRDWNPFV
jgi:hypothetical protein